MTCESIKCYNDWLLMLELEVYDGDLMNAVVEVLTCYFGIFYLKIVFYSIFKNIELRIEVYR